MSWNLWARKLKLLKVGALLYLLAALPTTAQIVPDNTLPVNSRVIRQGNTRLIEAGTTKGGNVFHSFKQFSTGTNSTTYFNNSLDVQNIFGRVTGGSISDIDGVLQANGTANLFLINPNGIIFGPNAQLKIGGSFLGSTASSINFADSTEFMANNPSAPPLLTVSTPIGLNFAGNPGEIRIQGPGHKLNALNFRPVVNFGEPSGLRVKPGKTLALVGGNVTLDGGILTAPGGHVKVGSADRGIVTISLADPGWALGYSKASSFRDIQLSTRALIDASGEGASSIQVQGRKLQLADGSVILIQNQGSSPAGDLVVNTSDSVLISGTDPIAQIVGSIRTETIAPGSGGNISINTPNFDLVLGGALSTTTFSSAEAGNVKLNVPGTIQLNGSSPLTPRAVSNINSASLSPFKEAKAGDISVETGQFIARNGGLLLSTTAGSGAGGDVTVNAKNLIELTGVEPTTYVPSAISASTVASGEAGDLVVNVPRLVLSDSGRIDSSTFASGKAGSITITAPTSIEVNGKDPGSLNPSLIISSANILNPELRQNFPLLPNLDALSGASGDVEIDTGNLSVINGGQISVQNDGTGVAGNLEVKANFINLNNQAGITASTASGKGGDVRLSVNGLSLLQNGSGITASAKGQGNGGNITIDTQLLAALGGSSISANAEQGSGGRVAITTQGLFVSPDSNIDASSQLGLDGIVEINTPELDFSKAATPPSPPPQAPEVSSVCQGRPGSTPSQFVKAGTGGIPRSPNDLLNKRSGWQEHPSAADVQAAVLDDPDDPEVQGWIIHPDGTMNFTTQPGVFYSTASTIPCTSATARD